MPVMMGLVVQHLLAVARNDELVVVESFRPARYVACVFVCYLERGARRWGVFAFDECGEPIPVLVASKSGLLQTALAGLAR